jgi:tetratricopeptide (TPR) repeat protein
MRAMPPPEGSPLSTESTQPAPSTAPAPLWRRIRWFVLLLVVAIVFAAAGGYVAGGQQRSALRSSDISQVTAQQFELGLQDLAAGRFELARQRFEYVIRLDPGYPHAAEQMAAALVGLKAPPATIPPPVTPTPNLAPVADLLAQAMAAYANRDWDITIDTLLALRAKDASYHGVEVDGMMYSSLRNRGLQRIRDEGLLEGGLYDLSRAERFAPLDKEAEDYRSWAELYLLANSYYGVNWAQAVYYFAQVYLVSPYITNDVYLKLATSAQRYGDELIIANDPCAAEEQYYQSLLAWENPDLIPTATKAFDRCEDSQEPPPPEDTPEPSPTPAETPTPTPG